MSAYLHIPWVAAFLWGFAGGLGTTVAELFLLRHASPDKRPWTSQPFYWITCLLMAAVGGGLVDAHLLATPAMSGVLEINIGASAPLFFSVVGKHSPTINPGARID